MIPRLVVYTDLDGTLLDHDSYDWAPAAPMLARLASLDIPVVIVTSKTRAEVAALRRALGNPHPFVAENGAVTLIPEGYFGADGVHPAGPDRALTALAAGPGRGDLAPVLAQLRRDAGYRFRTFAELGPAGIVEHTGLATEAAMLANAREGSEPLLWEDTPEALAAFRDALAVHGLACVRGGRFVHVMGPTDKAAAVDALHRRFEASAGGTLERVSLGDGPNDLAMLARADVAVVVRAKHHHPMPLETRGEVLRTAEYGPAGWAAAIGQVLASRGLHEEEAAGSAARHGDDGG